MGEDGLKYPGLPSDHWLNETQCERDDLQAREQRRQDREGVLSPKARALLGRALNNCDFVVISPPGGPCEVYVRR